MKILQISILLLLFALGSLFFYSEKRSKEIQVAFVNLEKKSYEESLLREKKEGEHFVRVVKSYVEQEMTTYEKVLQERVQLAVQNAKADILLIANMTKSKRELNRNLKKLFHGKNIFITDYNGNAIVKTHHIEIENIASYLDADNRAIVLEEIQKVRRHKSGFLKTKRVGDAKMEVVYVEAVDSLALYIGSSYIVEDEKERAEQKLLKTIENFPLRMNASLFIYEEEKLLYASEDCNLSFIKKQDGWSSDEESLHYYFGTHLQTSIQWYILYGFTLKEEREKFMKKREVIESFTLFSLPYNYENRDKI